MNNPHTPDDHGKCLETHECCSHNLIVDGPDEYPFQDDVVRDHVCEFIHVPREEITEIIKSGDIPLISISLENALDLQVVRCTPYSTPTAISHVWSDRLRNPQANTLPSVSCSRSLKRSSSFIFQGIVHSRMRTQARLPPQAPPTGNSGDQRALVNRILSSTGNAYISAWILSVSRSLSNHHLQKRTRIQNSVL